MSRIFLFIFLALFVTVPAQAVNPDEVLDDPVLEQRARDISSKLRCLVCQNQSIDDSDATLARDLRLIVRERLVAGDTDQQAINFIVARYGEFVLLKPVFAWHTLVLWLAAPITFILGLVFAIRRSMRQTAQQATTANVLTAAEKAKLEALLSQEE